MLFCSDCIACCRECVPSDCEDSADFDDDDAQSELQPIHSQKQGRAGGNDESTHFSDPAAYSRAKQFCHEDVDVEGTSFRLLPTFNATTDYYTRYPHIGHFSYVPLPEHYPNAAVTNNGSSEHLVSLLSSRSLNSPRGDLDDASSASSSSSTLSVRGTDQLLEQARASFKSDRARPNSLRWNEISRNLTHFQNAIRCEADLGERIKLIKEYETHKSDYDSDNKEDAEKAAFGLQNSQNKSYQPYIRLYNYQLAVKFTNSIADKECAWKDYISYCDSLK
jgi:hypothetical protein